MPPLPCTELNPAQQAQLLEIARRSIAQGFSTGAALRLEPADYDPELREAAAVFVTLTREGDLRGCIGSLQATDALVQAVASAAFNSAFLDRRFEPVRQDELDLLSIEISVLSPLEPLQVESRAALLECLRPGIDGLVIEDLGRRATFLPKVWEKIGSPQDFVEQLLLKAGLPAGYWADSISLQRYQCLTFADNQPA
jgi:AmmeMemoRadiSam system protein A